VENRGRSRTSLLQMLPVKCACAPGCSHDGFWDAVHVDEVIKNVCQTTSVVRFSVVFLAPWRILDTVHRCVLCSVFGTDFRSPFLTGGVAARLVADGRLGSAGPLQFFINRLFTSINEVDAKPH